jgi:hypothetical protein
MAVLAAIVSLGCVLAALRRLWLAMAADGLDAELLQRALADAGALKRLHAGLEARGGESSERELVAAACSPEAASRDALLDEQVIEADWASQRWAPVPRVCASIATSAGFLCGCMMVIHAVTADPADAAGAPSLLSAVGAVALGVAGASFCISVHVRLRPLLRARRAATDRLVDRLRALAGAAAA